MTRKLLERQFTLMVEWEVLRQLREKFGDKIPVTYEWLQGPLSEKPVIQVFVGQAGIELPVDIRGGCVYIRGLNEGYKPVNSWLSVREIKNS